MINFDCSSREYNGRYYNTFLGKGIEKYGGVTMDKKKRVSVKVVDEGYDVDEETKKFMNKEKEREKMIWENKTEQVYQEQEPDF
jgi:hypothetical protein